MELLTHFLCFMDIFEPETDTLPYLSRPASSGQKKYPEQKSLERKAAVKYRNKKPSNHYKGRVSVSGSNAGMTLEAALAVPLFLFAVLCLVYIFEIRAIEISIGSAAQSAAKPAAENLAAVPVLNPVRLKSDIVELVGADRLDQSIVEGGSAGIQCWKSYYNVSDEILYINIEYKVRLPFPGYRAFALAQRQAFMVKAWTGYKKEGIETEDEEIVYITEHGAVYHGDYHCSYLQLSIRFVPASKLSKLRNLDGGKYYACQKCVQGEAMAGVYITENGEKYHNSLNCSGLKRCIRAVKRSDIPGRRGCAKCTR